MGSSAMGATTLTKLLRNEGYDVKVKHSAIEDLTDDVEIVLTQKSLVERVTAKCPNAKVFVIQNFVNASEYADAIHAIVE